MLKRRLVMEVIEPLRVCRKCDLHAYTREDLEAFEKGNPNKYPYGRQTICVACERKDKASRMIKHRYGVTKEEYEECMNTSDCCEICGTNEKLVYDHDHTTMEFRGVLCRSLTQH